jgi:hypothetical protein
MGTSDLRRVIYLGGLGRSGSTLLERLLGELPGACTAGEVVHMWQRGIVEGERCGCGQPFGDCAFWRAVGQEAFGGWDAVDVGRIAWLREKVDRTRHIPLVAAPPPGPVRARIEEYVGYYARVYSALATVSGCDTVVDSSKHASLAFCLRRQPGLDLRVIHVVRDSRAVAYSWSRKVSRPDSPAATTYMTTYTPARAAGQWNLQNQALALLARTGTPTLRVRYEDLVAAPAATLAQIAEFAGLQADGEFGFLGADGEGPCADLHPAHTASGNPMRFLTGRVSIRGDDRWRQAMPLAQRRTVTALTFPLLTQYGYARHAA